MVDCHIVTIGTCKFDREIPKLLAQDSLTKLCCAALSSIARATMEFPLENRQMHQCGSQKNNVITDAG